MFKGSSLSSRAAPQRSSPTKRRLICESPSFKRLLRTKKRIVVISGAGISVNAGGGFSCVVKGDPADGIVPDFRTVRKSGQISFDMSAYNLSLATERFHISYMVPPRAWSM